MAELGAWLNSPWISLFGLFGGVSGLVSAGWTLWLYRKSEREKALARLSIVTVGTSDGFLKVDIGFTPPDRAESLVAVIRSCDPNVVVIYNAKVAMISDGQGGQVPAGPSEVHRERKLRVPLHYGRSSTAASTFFLAKRLPDGSNGKIDSGRVMICVETTASRTVLIRAIRAISAAV